MNSTDQLEIEVVKIGDTEDDWAIDVNMRLGDWFYLGFVIRDHREVTREDWQCILDGNETSKECDSVIRTYTQDKDGSDCYEFDHNEFDAHQHEAPVGSFFVRIPRMKLAPQWKSVAIISKDKIVIFMRFIFQSIWVLLTVRSIDDDRFAKSAHIGDWVAIAAHSF